MLDTCCLVPALQRDVLLQLAAERAYAPFWGSGILEELDYVLEELDHRAGRLDSDVHRRRLISQMRESFPDSEVEAPKRGDYLYRLADAGDGHVVRAALVSRADVLVTSDRRAGFETCPDLQDAGVRVISPPAFLVRVARSCPEEGATAVRAIAARSRNPPRTARQVLQQLAVTDRRHQDLQDILVELI